MLSIKTDNAGDTTPAPVPGAVLPHRIATLDGWRAVAVVAVIIAHARESLLPASHENFIQLFLMGLGHKGVELFFCLSGFLITAKLLDEVKRTGTVSAQTFYIRRCFRILPVQYVYLSTLVLMSWVGRIQIGPEDFVSSIFFFRNSIEGSPYTAHFWSLAIEEQFYFIWPWMLIWLPSRFWRVLAPGLALLFEFWHLVDLRFHLTALPGGIFRTDYNADTLLWGCTLALWAAFIRNSSRRSLSIGLFGFVALPLLVYLYIIRLPAREIWEPAPLSAAIGGTVFAPQLPLGRLLELRILKVIGSWSYSIYIWQQMLLPAFGLPNAITSYREIPLRLFLLLVMAAISYYLIEKPIIGFGKRFPNTQT